MDSKDKTGDILSSTGLQDTYSQGTLDTASYYTLELGQHVETTIMVAH